jgi:outer membrane protein assembly factor BamB
MDNGPLATDKGQMPDISQVLATIEQSNLVSDDVIEELRQRLEKSRQPADVKTAVKWLVQKEHITSDQGRRLLSRAGGGAEPQATRAAPADDDLQLFEEPPAAPPPPAKAPAGKAPPSLDDDLELFPLDDAAEAARVPPAPKPAKRPAARWAGTPKSKSPEPGAAQPRAPRRPPSQRGGSPSSAEAAYDAGADADIFAAATAEAGYGAGGGGEERQRKKAKNAQRNVWDSPLLLWVGGSVLLIAIAIVVLYLRIGRLSGDDAFKLAEESYVAGSYTQAIEQYDKYLESFPDHNSVSLARVHRGMARMRQAVEGSRDFSKTLATAKSLLAEISAEDQFGDAQKELAALLPQIAEGLAKQASVVRPVGSPGKDKSAPVDAKSNAKLVEEGEETLKLVEKYVRKTLRPEQKLADVRASLELTKRALGRDTALKDAVAGIDKAIAEGDPQRAYQLRKALLKQYPSLAGEPTLQAAVLSLSKAEQAAVAYKAEERPAAPADTQSPVEAEVVLGDTQGKNAPGVKGQIVQALAGGATYAFEADTGKILWRRFVGFDTNYLPRPIAVDADSDLLVVDSQRHEVLRVERRSGTLKWRHVVGEPFDSQPVVARGHVWIATRGGKLLTIEAETGNSPGYVSLPQGLRVSPAFDSREQVCYQLGENSNLFSISASTFQCQEVLYLGHEPESIHVPPLVINPYIFVVEDQGASDSLLHVLMADENGANVRQAQEPVTLAGHVLSPLQASGRTLVAATDRGAIYSFEINPPDPGPPLTKVAEKPADDRSPLVRFPLLKDTQLWVAGIGLTKYDVQASRGKLDPRWIKDEGDIFIEQPSLVDKVLFHARRRGNQPDVLIAAVSAQDGSRYWETRVAAPPAGAPVTDAASGRLRLFNRVGAIFDLAPESLAKNGVQNAQGSPADLTEPFSSMSGATILADGLAAISSAESGPRAWVAPESGNPRWLPLPEALGAPAIAFHGGLLAPGRLGQVLVIDPVSGKSLLQPFQPRLERGTEFRWSTPLLINEREVLLADGQSKLYRLAIANKPEPRLAEVAEARLAGPITAPLAKVGATVYAASGDDELVAFALGGGANTLAAGKSWPLASGAAWGPYTAGDYVLVASRAGQLLCLDARQQLVWQTDFKRGSLSGTPLAVDDAVLVTTKSGLLCRLAIATGEELGMADVGEPIAAGPIALGERVLLASKAGTLLVVALP